MRTAGVALSLLVGCTGQSAEWSPHDAAVANLCDVTEGAAPGGPVPADLTVQDLEQVEPTKARLSAPGAPDAVWLTDSTGTVVAFQASPNLPVLLDFGADAADLKPFAHYSSCHIVTANAALATWKKKYDDYVSNDEASFSGDLDQTTIMSAQPTITVNYDARSATVTFTQATGVGVPHAYVKDSNGLVLTYIDSWANPPGNDEDRTLNVAGIPDSATSVIACTLSCVSYSLKKDIVDSVNANAVNTGQVASLSICASATTPCGLPTSMANDILTVGASDACKASGGSYKLFAEPTGGGDPIALGMNQALTVDAGGLSNVVIKQDCAGALSSMSVDLAPLRAAYNAAIDSSTLAPMTESVPPLSCEMGGKSYAFNEVWDGHDGETCLCVQGVAQCGGSTKRGIYFDNVGIIGVTLSVVLIFIVVALAGYYAHMQKKSRAIIEGRRKSKGGNTYFGSGGASIQRGQEEIELPGGQRNLEVNTL